MSSDKKTKIEGEGSYTATRKFQKAQHEFAGTEKAKEKAREAAEALDSEEAEKLEKARQAAAQGDSLTPDK